MTARIGAAARAAAAARTEIVAVNPTSGPASIEGYFDEAFAAPGVIEEVIKGEAAGSRRVRHRLLRRHRARGGALRPSGPVIGIGEAAFHLASLIAHRFSVVTTLVALDRADRGAIWSKYGLAARCARVRACEVPVLALDDPASGRARETLGGNRTRASARTAPRRSCSAAPAWRNSPHRSRANTGCRSIDGVAAAVKLAEALVGLGHATSKRGPYARPIAKPFAGKFADISA